MPAPHLKTIFVWHIEVLDDNDDRTEAVILFGILRNVYSQVRPNLRKVFFVGPEICE